MSTFESVNHYYSGQGVVLVGDRDAVTGKAKGLIQVGNVSALKLGLATTVVTHRESQTGQRAIDLRLITELNCSVSMTIEDFSAQGLANALAGSWQTNLAGAVSAEASKVFAGKIMGVANIMISSFVLTHNATALTAYVNDSTAWDYKVNTDAGSFLINDGSVISFDKLCTASPYTAPNAITAGYPTVLGWAATPPAAILAIGVGGKLAIAGFSGADAALINKKAFTVMAFDATAKTVSLNVDTSGKTLTVGTPLITPDGDALSIAYNFATQNRIDAMTALATEKFMRFEGLNTADGGNPVIVEVYRFIVDPLKELALISDGVGPFDLEGNCLVDNTRAVGSKFYNILQLR